MSHDQCLRQALQRYAVNTGAFSPARSAAQLIEPTIREWAGQYLISVEPSGSFTKGTAVSNGTDIDLFVSLSSTTPDTLAEVYSTLFNKMQNLQYQNQPLQARRQNVSIGITLSGTKIDIVPGKRQDQWSNDHNLFRSRANTWTQTNVTQHINLVTNSGRTDEIRILKIWRNRHNLNFPSLFLELAVIEALKGKRTGDLSNNVIAALEYLKARLATARLVDPANTNNVVSNDLSAARKQAVASAATITLNGSWQELVG